MFAAYCTQELHQMIYKPVFLAVTIYSFCLLTESVIACNQCSGTTRCMRAVPATCCQPVITCCRPILDCPPECVTEPVEPPDLETEPRIGTPQPRIETPDSEDIEETELPLELPELDVPKEFSDLLVRDGPQQLPVPIVRKWTHRDGRTCVANFLDSSTTHVRLEKGGKVYEVEIAALSEGDRRFLHQQNNASALASR